MARAAEPGLAPGAAERIADGAWARSDALRRAAATRPARTLNPRRLGIGVAAAAALVATTLLSVRAADPAFAVEGDSVQVLDRGAWEDARRVPVGAWVFVRPGSRSSIRHGDSVIEPAGGALLRIVAQGGARLTWNVDLRSGDAEISGSSVTLGLSDSMQVAKANDVRFLRVSATVGDRLDAAPRAVEFEHAIDAARRHGPSVTVHEGVACVVNASAADYMLLRPQESAALVRLGFAANIPHLVRESSWSPEVAVDVVRGARFVAAADRGEGRISLVMSAPDRELRSVFVSAADRRDVFSQIHLLQADVARFAADARAVRATVDVDVLARRLAPVRTLYEHGPESRRTTIAVATDGAATLTRPDGSVDEFPSVEALRSAAPDSAALFGDRLE